MKFLLEQIEELEGIEIPGYTDTWSEIDRRVVNGVIYYLMENDEWGDETCYLLITKDFSTIAETYDDIDTALFEIFDEQGNTSYVTESLNEDLDFNEGCYIYTLTLRSPEGEDYTVRDYIDAYNYNRLSEEEKDSMAEYFQEYYDDEIVDISAGEYADEFDNSDDPYWQGDNIDEKLIQSPSKKALQKNIKTEIKAGKNPKQAAAIAYSIRDEVKKKSMKEAIQNEITLHYENLPITYQYNHTVDYWDGKQWEEKDIEIEWDYNVAKEDILDAIIDEVADEMYKKFLDKEDFSDSEINKYFSDNFDRLFKTYNKQILDYFKDDAINDAEENYEEDDEYDYDDEDLDECLTEADAKYGATDKEYIDSSDANYEADKETTREVRKELAKQGIATNAEGEPLNEEENELIDQLVKDGYFQEGEIISIKYIIDDLDPYIIIETKDGKKSYQYVGGRLFDYV